MSAGRARAGMRRSGFVVIAAMGLITGCGELATAPGPSCVDAAPLTPGRERTGVLAGDDDRRAGAYIDYYSVQTADSAELHIEMSSDRVDPFLYLLDADGQVLAQAFDTTGPREAETARLSHRVGAGCHLVGASSWTADAMGAYTIRVELDPEPGEG